MVCPSEFCFNVVNRKSFQEDAASVVQYDSSSRHACDAAGYVTPSTKLLSLFVQTPGSNFSKSQKIGCQAYTHETR